MDEEDFMYRVIIVEDEAVLRKGLTNFVPWNKLGFEVCNTFPDGEEAYIWLKTNLCDVVLTDIMMGKMDGLELANRIHVESPHIKVVILSGYADFANARTAIQYGVTDFLEKPVDEEELAETFRKIKEELDSKDKENLDKEELTTWSQLLVLEINSGNNESIGNILGDYMDRIISLPLIAIQKRLEHLCYEIAMEYSSRGIDVWTVSNKFFSIRSVYQQHDYQSLYDCVMEMFLALKAGIAGNKKEETDDYIIERIKRYIQNHIGEDMGNAAIARAHKLHPVYMGKLFREQTGMTLSEYIIKVRMERACELLKKSKYSIGEIGRMVGYNTSYYFSVVFKKYTGFTPTEYRDKVVKN